MTDSEMQDLKVKILNGNVEEYKEYLKKFGSGDQDELSQKKSLAELKKLHIFLLSEYYEMVVKDFDNLNFDKETAEKVCTIILCIKDEFSRNDIAKAYFIEAVCDRKNSFEYLEKAIKEGDPDNCIYQMFIEEYMHRVRNKDELCNSDDIVERIVKTYGCRSEYKYIKGLVLFENGEYNKCLEINEYRLAKQKGLIYYRNLGGNHLNLEKANDFFKRVRKDAEIAQLVNTMNEQKQIDYDSFGKNMVVNISDLKVALQNEIQFFYDVFESFFAIKISNEVKDKLGNVNIVFSYYIKQDIYKPRVDDVIPLVQGLEEKIKNVIKELNIRGNGEDSESVADHALNDMGKILDELRRDGIDGLSQSSKMMSDRLLTLFERYPAIIRDIKRITVLLNMGTTYTLGEYLESENKIVLYLSNIYNSAKSISVRPELYVVSVFIHELFHAAHYFLCNEKSQYDKHSTIIKESLASYFQYKYFDLNIDDKENRSNLYYADNMKKSNKKDICYMIERDWNFDMNDYPYAGARYMQKYQNGFCNNHLCQDLFYKSILSFEDAYNVLNYFYALENS